MAAPVREDLHCDCCGREIMAQRQGSTIVVTTKRHGQRHILMLKLDKDAESTSHYRVVST